MRKTLVPAAALFLLAIGQVPAAAEAAPLVAGRGSGIERAGAPFAGDRVTIDIAARGEGQTATGHFRLWHFSQDGSLFAELRGTVECLHVAGGFAATTGEISDGHIVPLPDFDPSGYTIAISIADGAPDEFGATAEFLSGPISPCQSVAPFAAVDVGQFVVR